MLVRKVPRPHYILKMYVDNSELKAKYEQIAIEQNRQIQRYLAGDNIMLDSGVDLFCPNDCIIPGGQVNKEDYKSVKVGQGIKCCMLRVGESLVRNIDGELEFKPDYPGRCVGYYMYCRSSTGSKTPLRLSNNVGIIDPGYRGELCTVFDNLDKNDYIITKYQRLVQICCPDLSYPIAIELVNNLKDLGVTDRGDGGIGSTGM